MLFKAVLFDMDGLLLDSERQYLEAFLRSCKFFGLRNMEHVFYDCIGLRLDDRTKVLEKAFFDRVDLENFNAKWDIFISQKSAEEIPLKAGVKELLRILKSSGTPRIVATSTRSEKAIQHLKITGIYDLISHVVGGDEVKHGKPDPEIYLKAAAKAGFPAEDCAAFEDSDIGILAAVRSGATAVQVPDLKKPSVNTRSLGHLIAKDLLSGAKEIGLI